jgi:two-component system phosphate regulon sensor histidine kinase PhoR
MSTALIGIIAIQAYWLNFSISLNERKFNQSVRDALYQVKRKIEKEVSQGGLNPYSAQDKPVTLGKQSSSFLRMEYFFGDRLLDTFYKAGDYLEQQRLKDMSEVLALLQEYPVEDLIDPKALDQLIQSELKLRGVDAQFISGVYSYKTEEMVIYNGHYVAFPEGEPKSSDPGIQLPDTYTLSGAQYKVDLFSSGLAGALGQLRLLFPNKSRAIWKDSWLLLLGSLIFTGLILFGFSYTIYVIFRQKKIGEMKNDFINNMTHEFKTPIATISLATDSLISDKVIKEPAKVKRFAKIITQENKRMLNQVEKVLQMALIDRQDFNMHIEEIHLHELIENAIDFIGLQVDKRGGKLSKKLEASRDKIEGDATHLSNIFHNLLDNANKYSSEEPDIIVTTKNVPNGVEIEIIDHGIGMTKEAKKQIFEKFYRVHTGNVHDVKGFGLGLSYVKVVVTAHNGSIDVESSLGEGSTFTIFLPFKQT